MSYTTTVHTDGGPIVLADTYISPRGVTTEKTGLVWTQIRSGMAVFTFAMSPEEAGDLASALVRVANRVRCDECGE